MFNLISLFYLLVIALAGWLNRRNRSSSTIYRSRKEQLKERRFRLIDEQRIRLAVNALAVG